MGAKEGLNFPCKSPVRRRLMAQKLDSRSSVESFKCFAHKICRPIIQQARVFVTRCVFCVVTVRAARAHLMEELLMLIKY